MTEALSPETTVTRLIHDEQEIILARGDFGPLLRTFLQHSARWETPLDGLTETMMRQGLAATALHLSCRPNDEHSGFTLNFSEPPINIFLTGDASTSAVTGRAFVDGVRTAESSRLFLQTHRRRGGLSESTIEITGLDVLDVFEQYYRQSLQMPGRFFELDDQVFAMVIGLPGCDPAWVKALDREQIRNPGPEYRPLEERQFRFQCGCSRDRMIAAVRGIFREKPSELFQGDDGVEVQCPRCGTRWWLEREAFEAETDGPAAETDAGNPSPGDSDEPGGTSAPGDS